MNIKSVISRTVYEVMFKHLPSSSSVFGGKLYKRLRAAAAKGFIVSCGKNVNIEHNATFSSRTSIGDNSGIGVNCVCGGELIIGRDVMMGPNVTIFSRNHEFSNTDIPMWKQGFKEAKPCCIGDDVWIGKGVMIMPGINIGSHSIIGAGAVVTKDVPEWAIVAGNPAVVKKYRIENKSRMEG